LKCPDHSVGTDWPRDNKARRGKKKLTVQKIIGRKRSKPEHTKKPNVQRPPVKSPGTPRGNTGDLQKAYKILYY